jgi:hypothetical protein
MLLQPQFMQKSVQVVKEGCLIIMCTIHQPSTMVYKEFDELMIMSRGGTFAGVINDAIPFFESVGLFLDLVKSDSSDEAGGDGLSGSHTLQSDLY